MESAAASPSCCFRAQRNGNINSGAAVASWLHWRRSRRRRSPHGVVERLVDPMKMSSLMQDKTDTELNSDGSFANIGHLPILDQPTGSLQIPSSPAPVPPPDGKLCIHRRHWANLERQPSELPAEHGAGAAAEHAFVQPPPPPPACSRPSSYQLVD